MRKRLIAVLGLLLVLTLASGAATASPLLGPTLSRTLLINLINETGQPVGNAEVQLLTPGSTSLVTARTNAQGQAKLSLPNGFSFWLRVWADGQALIERAYVPASDGQSLTLKATSYTAVLSGLVRDDRGLPVVGATVKLYQTGMGLEATTVTTAMGAYTFAKVQAAANHVIQVEAKGYQPISQAVEALNAAQRNQLDLDLVHATGAVTGEIMDSRTLRPLGSMNVELILSGWGVVASTTSDASGFFYLPAPPSGDGSYQVRLSRPFFETTTSGTFNMPAGGWVDFSGSSRFTVNRLYAQLSGKVFDSNNAPMAKVQVHLQRQNLGTVETAMTDEAGRYRFENLTAGTYRVRAMPTSDQIHADGGWLTINGGQDVQSDITIDAIETATYGAERLTGKVENHLGDPVPGATVTVARGQTSYTAKTDENGSYDVEVSANVPKPQNTDDDPGTGYHVIVTAPGYLANDQPKTEGDALPASLIDVQESADNRADFTLRPEHANIAGRIMDIYGQPVANAKVLLVEEGKSVPVETVTDLFGRYLFEELPVGKQGRYTVAVKDPQYVPGAIDPNGAILAPTALDPANPLILTLVAHPSTTLIQGVVQAGAQRIDNQATVTVVRASTGATYESKVSEEGLYQIRVPAFPGEQYLVRVNSPKIPENIATDLVDPGTNYGTLVNLTTHPTGTLAGRVLAATGEPTPGANVFLYAEGTDTVLASTAADLAGVYRFANLTPGRRYAVLAENGPFGLSTLAPGETVITPLVGLPSGETVWADIQTSTIPTVTNP